MSDRGAFFSARFTSKARRGPVSKGTAPSMTLRSRKASIVKVAITGMLLEHAVFVFPMRASCFIVVPVVVAGVYFVVHGIMNVLMILYVLIDSTNRIILLLVMLIS